MRPRVTEQWPTDLVNVPRKRAIFGRKERRINGDHREMKKRGDRVRKRQRERERGRRGILVSETYSVKGWPVRHPGDSGQQALSGGITSSGPGD